MILHAQFQNRGSEDQFCLPEELIQGLFLVILLYCLYYKFKGVEEGHLYPCMHQLALHKDTDCKCMRGSGFFFLGGDNFVFQDF